MHFCWLGGTFFLDLGIFLLVNSLTELRNFSETAPKYRPGINSGSTNGSKLEPEPEPEAEGEALLSLFCFLFLFNDSL
eukprot:1343209-Amorphochlora_amoeboformis.AAC.2